jgi:hypothetical protein
MRMTSDERLFLWANWFTFHKTARERRNKVMLTQRWKRVTSGLSWIGVVWGVFLEASSPPGLHLRFFCLHIPRGVTLNSTICSLDFALSLVVFFAKGSTPSGFTHSVRLLYLSRI